MTHMSNTNQVSVAQRQLGPPLGAPEESQPSCWTVNGQSYYAVSQTVPKLAAGFYGIHCDERGPHLRQQRVTTDGLLKLPDPVTDMLVTEFIDFWKFRGAFEKANFSARRGLLLYGPPGSGKTSALQLMAAHMIEKMRGVVVLAGEPDWTARCLADFRMIEPTRPLIVVYEDLDALIGRYGEPQLLSLLDGELTVGDVVNIATTNYPELLPPRLIDRPGRFDRVERVGMPSAAARRVYLKARLRPLSQSHLEKYVECSDGWSVAHLRELVVATDVLGLDPDETIARLAGMAQPIGEERGRHQSAAFGFDDRRFNTQHAVVRDRGR